MKVLAWDTSSKVGCIAAAHLNESKESKTEITLAAEFFLNLDLQQSEQLLWGVDCVLTSLRWNLRDIDTFLVGTGPGSFTGLRVGITTARTLAHTLEKPLFGLSSLEALCVPARIAILSQKIPAVIVAATDAAKGEFFIRIEPPRGKPIEFNATPELAILKIRAVLKKFPKSTWFGLGEVFERYPGVWQNLPKSKRVSPPLLFPHQIQGRSLVELGSIAHLKGSGPLDHSALLVRPNYMRASAAEVNLQSRNRTLSNTSKA